MTPIEEEDPDVIEGHNLFKFDLEYLRVRCKRHRCAVCLGGSDSGVVPQQPLEGG